jgi:hypothetical protein
MNFTEFEFVFWDETIEFSGENLLIGGIRIGMSWRCRRNSDSSLVSIKAKGLKRG